MYDYFYHPAACTDKGGAWYADVNGSGCIDIVDIIWWANENFWSPLCNLSKADNSEENGRILSWFGIRPTGRMITDRGRELPELEVASPPSMRRAIQNPYGYRDAVTSGQPAAWSRVKSIYK